MNTLTKDYEYFMNSFMNSFTGMYEYNIYFININHNSIIIKLKQICTCQKSTHRIHNKIESIHRAIHPVIHFSIHFLEVID